MYSVKLQSKPLFGAEKDILSQRLHPAPYGDPPENWAPRVRLSKSLKVIGSDTDRPVVSKFVLTFHGNHGYTWCILAVNKKPGVAHAQFSGDIFSIFAQIKTYFTIKLTEFLLYVRYYE